MADDENSLPEVAAAESSASTFNPQELRRRYSEERDRRLRSDGTEQYVEMTGKFAHYLEDPYITSAPVREPLQEDVEVVVVGGGFSGLQLGGRLKQAGIDNFRIIEKGGDFGGTWYWNRYPGAACDVESYIYLPFLEELGRMPSEKYVGAPEIMAHCQAVGRHFGLYDKALFQTEATKYSWDEERSRWIVTTSLGDEIRARFLCIGSGIYHMPKLPGIPGLESFKGHSFHTTRWDYDYTGGDSRGGLVGLRDKRVAVIGTGATAIQIIPHLGEWAKELYVFQRTPSSIDVRNNRATDQEWAKTLEPGWQAKRRENFEQILLGMPLEEDLVADAWTDLRKHLPQRDGGELTPEVIQLADYSKMEAIRGRVDDIVKDPATAAALKPYYNRFCKRPCFHDDYLPTFNRPNVTLVDTKGQGVERITENALIADGKSYEVDCIIFATGFEIANERSRKAIGNVHGRGGVTLSERWADGPHTLQGMLSHRFPNLFLLLPGNQTALSFNFPLIIDLQSQHAARIIKRCEDEGIRTLEVREEAEKAWQAEIDANSLADMPTFKECTPGYFNGEGNIASSLWGNIYAPGPFVYREKIDRWFEERFEQDLDIVR